jgi:alkylated DNA repair protein (DNA oxidative demethylase)
MSLLFSEASLPRPARELSPGAVHIPGFLTVEQQAWIVRQYLSWRHGPVPAHHPLIGQHPMSVQSLCLGWHWTQGGYTKTADNLGGGRVLEVPDWMVRLAQKAASAAQELTDAELMPDGPFTPDMLLANYYAPQAVMGMHQDAHEHTRAPIISFSIGDSCVFRLGNTETRTQPYEDVRLISGDLFVFGGPARFAFHGVPRVFPGTAPRGIGVSVDDDGPGGRLNVTVRQVMPQADPR